MTGFGSINVAVDAMRLGADDFLDEFEDRGMGSGVEVGDGLVAAEVSPGSHRPTEPSGEQHWQPRVIVRVPIRDFARKDHQRAIEQRRSIAILGGFEQVEKITKLLHLPGVDGLKLRLDARLVAVMR